MEECAEKLIKAGVLYADDTPVDKMREVGDRAHLLVSSSLQRCNILSETMLMSAWLIQLL